MSRRYPYPEDPESSAMPCYFTRSQVFPQSVPDGWVMELVYPWCADEDLWDAFQFMGSSEGVIGRIDPSPLWAEICWPPAPMPEEA